MKLISHGPNCPYQVSCEYRLDDDRLIADFIVTKPEELDWNTDKNFSREGIGNWKLWEHDVVEFFIQDRDEKLGEKSPYIELQLSPLDQKFALIVERPRESYYTPQDFDFSGHSKTDGNSWQATIEVKIPRDTQLYGGTFSCLGPKDKRHYLASNPNKEAQPDFHRPELFKPL